MSIQNGLTNCGAIHFSKLPGKNFKSNEQLLKKFLSENGENENLLGIYQTVVKETVTIDEKVDTLKTACCGREFYGDSKKFIDFDNFLTVRNTIKYSFDSMSSDSKLLAIFDKSDAKFSEILENPEQIYFKILTLKFSNHLIKIANDLEEAQNDIRSFNQNIFNRSHENAKDFIVATPYVAKFLDRPRNPVLTFADQDKDCQNLPNFKMYRTQDYLHATAGYHSAVEKDKRKKPDNYFSTEGRSPYENQSKFEVVRLKDDMKLEQEKEAKYQKKKDEKKAEFDRKCAEKEEKWSKEKEEKRSREKEVEMEDIVTQDKKKKPKKGVDSFFGKKKENSNSTESTKSPKKKSKKEITPEPKMIQKVKTEAPNTKNKPILFNNESSSDEELVVSRKKTKNKKHTKTISSEEENLNSSSQEDEKSHQLTPNTSNLKKLKQMKLFDDNQKKKKIVSDKKSTVIDSEDDSSEENKENNGGQNFKYVTKIVYKEETYEDDEGFLVTKKVPVEKKVKVPIKDSGKKQNVSNLQSNKMESSDEEYQNVKIMPKEVKKPKKEVVKKVVKKKQGQKSISSFFAKK